MRVSVTIPNAPHHHTEANDSNLRRCSASRLVVTPVRDSAADKVVQGAPECMSYTFNADGKCTSFTGGAQLRCAVRVISATPPCPCIL